MREAYELMISYYKDKNRVKTQLYYVEKLLEVDKKLHNTYTYLQGKIRKEYDTKELVDEQQNLRVRSICENIMIKSPFLSLVLCHYL